MLCIYTQNKFLPEKKYTFDVIIKEFLGFDFEIKFHETDTYKIVVENGKYIEFSDFFFSKFDENIGYFSIKNIPEKPVFIYGNKFFSEDDLPIIFGNNIFEITENKILLGQDIFASSFFMLTRWEEYVNKNKDIHGRFPDSEAFVVVNNLKNRPLVNEYTVFLLNLLRKSGFTDTEKKHQYKAIITHDVDEIARYNKFSKFIRALGGDILNRKSLKSFIKTNIDYTKIILGRKKDNYDTFEYLMQVSEQNNLKSHFYFIPSFLGEEDSRYDIRDKQVEVLINKIKSRGHVTGFHGAYRSFSNNEFFATEMNRLKTAKIDTKEGRQHYLRFLNPKTWQIQSDNGIETDSTMGFSYGGGFRAGTCFEYPVFNIQNREKLKLTERPLIAMEVAIRAKYPEIKELYKNIIQLSEIVKKYNGNFVFLWHNSNFNTFEWNFASEYYPKIIEKISKK